MSSKNAFHKTTMDRVKTPDFKTAAVQTGNSYILGMDRDEIPTAKSTFQRSPSSKVSRLTSNENDTGG